MRRVIAAKSPRVKDAAPPQFMLKHTSFIVGSSIVPRPGGSASASSDGCPVQVPSDGSTRPFEAPIRALPIVASRLEIGRVSRSVDIQTRET